MPQCPDPVFIGIALLNIIIEVACGSVLFSLTFKFGVPTDPAQLPACTSTQALEDAQWLMSPVSVIKHIMVLT